MTLSRDLAQRSDEELRALLERRPDLVRDPPVSFADLAGRLSSTPAARAAIIALDRWARDVLEAVVFLEGRGTSVAVAELLVLGQGLAARPVLPDVERAMRTLRDSGLVWHDGAGHATAVEPVRLGIQRPFGFGRSLRVLAAARTRDELLRIARAVGVAPGPSERTSKEDLIERLSGAYESRDAVFALFEGAPRGTRELFTEAVSSGGVRVPYTYGFSPAARHQRPDLDWLIARGLLMRSTYDVAEVPREIALTMRGVVVHTIETAAPPADDGASVIDPRDRDATAAAAATSIVAKVEALCMLWGDQPAATLRATGGVGAREFKRVAKALNVDESTVPFVIELAAAARLVAMHASRNEQHVLPTNAFDDWRALPTAGRWQVLVDAWRSAPRWLSVAGNRDQDDKLVPALASLGTSVDAITQRHAVVDALAEMPEGTAPTVDALAEHVSWHAPGLWIGPAPVPVLVEWVLIEMEVIGLTGNGAAITCDAETLLGAATADVTLQADLTAIATGALVPELAALLDDAADLESAGAAKVWRFSDASVRRALDLGRDAESMIDALSAAATRGMPQPLQYLIADVARRHGLLRGSSVASYVRADDAALLASAVRVKGASRLGLRLVAPTVAVAHAPIAKVLEVLRAAGMSPVEEDESGGVLVRGRSAQRTATPSPALPARPSSVVPIDARRSRGVAGSRDAAPPDPAAIIRMWRDSPDVRGVR